MTDGVLTNAQLTQEVARLSAQQVALSELLTTVTVGLREAVSIIRELEARG